MFWTRWTKGIVAGTVVLVAAVASAGPSKDRTGGRVPADLAWGSDGTGFHLVNFALDNPGVFHHWGDFDVFLLGGVEFDKSGTFDTLYGMDGVATVSLVWAFDTATGFGAPVGSGTAFNTESFTDLATDPLTGQIYVAGCAFGESTSSLYTLQPTTNDGATRIGPITNAACITGLAIHPGTGQMYGAEFVFTGNPSGNLVAIDRATGAGTVVGPLGVGLTVFGMDFDDSDGTLYVFTRNFATLQGELRTVDLATGATTLVGPLGADMVLAAIAAVAPSPVILPAGSVLTAEGCAPGNGVIDPGETVTVDFAFQNVGVLDTTDMVATLQASGGVTPLTTSQDYGVLVAGGPAVSRAFQFVASGTCGGTLAASFDLQDGPTSLGTRTFNFTLGSTSTSGPTTFSNPGTIVINDAAPATPFPSEILVSGLTGNVSKVTLTLHDVTHSFPADIAVMLESPTGLTVGLMGNAGGGDPGVVDVTFTLDDDAPSPIPEPLVPGTYRPTTLGPLTFPPPAPPPPYGETLSVLDGTISNGTWRLWVRDDAPGDSGTIGGWSLDVTTSMPVCCSTPALSMGDVAAFEGNLGTGGVVYVPLNLSPASPTPVMVHFETADGTATVADFDYLPISGDITFAPGQTSAFVTVDVVGDPYFEHDEDYFVNLSNAVGATILDGTGEGVILNDDGLQRTDTRDELVHASRETEDLFLTSRFWRISQKAHSSYEVVVDAVTGDIGAGGPDLLRLAADGTTVLQSGTPATGGSSKSLRFENPGSGAIDGQFIQVRSEGCGNDCDTNDTMRIRAYDTTYRFSRFNNSASQITVVVIANPTDRALTGTLWFYANGGQLLTSQPVAAPAHGTFVLNTSTVGALQGQAGSATFSNDAAFGALAGKAVAVEPATGFTFDTPMLAR